MSYTTMKVFDKNGDAQDFVEFQNAFYLNLLAVWERLAVKYGLCSEDKFFHLVSRPDQMKKVWDLQYSSKVTDDDWYVLMSTFDNVVIPPNLIERVASAFEKFSVSGSAFTYRGRVYADKMRETLQSVEGCRGIAFHSTSVIDDPWYLSSINICPNCEAELDVNEEEGCLVCPECDFKTECERPYNLDKDSKHWFLPVREGFKLYKRVHDKKEKWLEKAFDTDEGR